MPGRWRSAWRGESTRRVTGRGLELRRWDVGCADTIETIRLHTGATRAALAPDGSCIVTVASSGATRSHGDCGQIVGMELGREVPDIGFSPTSQRLYAIDGQGAVRLWDRSLGEVPARAPVEGVDALRAATRIAHVPCCDPSPPWHRVVG